VLSSALFRLLKEPVNYNWCHAITELAYFDFVQRVTAVFSDSQEDLNKTGAKTVSSATEHMTLK
jgi:hypothetical protein